MLSFRCLFVPLGVDSTPLGQRKSLEILPSIGSALGGMFNLFGQESANKANLEAVEKTNQMNYQIAKEANQMSQSQFNENMKWLREQYYDTEQVKRAVSAARKAGLNPALALGQVQPIGSVGQSSPTQFHAAQMEAGHVEPLQIGDGISESIGHSVDAFYNNQLRQAQAENVGVDSQIKRAQAMTEFASRVADIRSKYADIEAKLAQKGVSDATREKVLAEKDKLDFDIKVLWSTFDEQVKAAKYGNKLLKAQAENLDSQTVLNGIEANFKPLLHKANLRLSAAQATSLLEHIKLIVPQALNLMSQRDLNRALRKHEVAKTVAQYAMNELSDLDLAEKKRLFGEYNSSKIGRFMKDFSSELGDLLEDLMPALIKIPTK